MTEPRLFIKEVKDCNECPLSEWDRIQDEWICCITEQIIDDMKYIPEFCKLEKVKK